MITVRGPAGLFKGYPSSSLVYSPTMPSSSASPPSRPTECPCCPHKNSHYFIRCGCPNDKPPSHPVHIMDDAFHREWCSTCLLFCVQPATCHHKRHKKAFSNILSRFSRKFATPSPPALADNILQRPGFARQVFGVAHVHRLHEVGFTSASAVLTLTQL